MTPYRKTPAEVLDYGFDWATWLGAATIVTAVHSVPAGLSLVAESSDGDSTTVWIGGGSNFGRYPVVTRITDSAGHTAERTLWIAVVPHRSEC